MRTLKKQIIYLFLLLINPALYAQELVVNGDFNMPNKCTEYHALCAPKGWYSSDDGSGYNMLKEEGIKESRCLTLLVKGNSRPDTRNFWQTQMILPMLAGKTYRIRFMLHPYRTQFFGNMIQLLFTSEKTEIKTWRMVNATPSISFTIDNTYGKIKDGWISYEATYQANGTEKWLLLGNFLKDTQLPDSSRFNTTVDDRGIFYLVENFSIKPVKHLHYNKQQYKESAEAMLSIRERHPKPAVEYSLAVDTPVAAATPHHEVIDTIRFSDILFKTNDHALNMVFKEDLDTVVARIKTHEFLRIIVNGYTDSTGRKETNLTLSENRAGTVRRYLETAGLPADKLTSKGYGDADPIAPNNTPEGRTKNRRVEIIIVRKN